LVLLAQSGHIAYERGSVKMNTSQSELAAVGSIPVIDPVATAVYFVFCPLFRDCPPLTSVNIARENSSISPIAAPSAPQATSAPTVINNTTNNYTTTNNYYTTKQTKTTTDASTFTTALNDLETRLTNRIASINIPVSGPSAPVYTPTFAQATEIDNL